MGTIHQINKLTDCRFLNLYNVKATSVHDTPVNYYVASRSESVEEMQHRHEKNIPDGVIIYSVYREKGTDTADPFKGRADKVVLIRQYRYTIGDYIYEFPAGLVEAGEDYHEAAIREMKEETGLTLTPLKVADGLQKPFYTTVGMTDECCASVYGFASGQISADLQENSEEIEVVIADRDEVRRILREEKVAIMCAYMLMHFLHDEEPFAFLSEL